MRIVQIKVNGVVHEVSVDGEKPLLWVLREDLAMTGTKYSCGIGQCGACDVLLDGELNKSCLLPVSEVGEREVTTIEGLDDEVGASVKAAWIEVEASQCGFCQPGQVIAATHLLRNNPAPSMKDVETAMTNLCRCGTYHRIRTAIETAAASLGNKK